MTTSTEELDLHGKYALSLAGGLHDAMAASKTSFPDISGQEIWEKLYYSGMIPSVIRFIHQKQLEASIDEQERTGLTKFNKNSGEIVYFQEDGSTFITQEERITQLEKAIRNGT